MCCSQRSGQGQVKGNKENQKKKVVPDKSLTTTQKVKLETVPIFLENSL